MQFEPQVVEISLDEIIPNRFQPRLAFDENALEELSASIKEHGIIQPLVLRRVQDKYEIIAGERRFKAASKAGLTKVPAIVTNIDDNKSAEVALVENVQRKGLTPIEEARSYKVLLDRGYITQDELAKKMGISQSSISNKLRLLNLDDSVQQALLEEKISERHARSLLQLPDKNQQKELLEKVVNERLTVRQVDAEIKKMQKEDSKMDDTPLVDIAPSIDEIKTVATDINPTRVSPVLEEMLKTEEQVKTEGLQLPEEPTAGVEPIPSVETNAPVVDGPIPTLPVEPTPSAEVEPTPSPEPNAPSKFFNFLEDEEANLDMGAELPPLPPTPEEVTPVETPSAPQVEVLDFPGMPAPAMANENIVDPVSQIDTLDPNYVPPAPPQAPDVFDLTKAINLIRETTKTIENNGLVVDTEEIDLENLYQVIIKIDKEIK